MIGWTTINPVLLDVFRECALDTARSGDKFKAEWKDRPASFMDPAQKLALLLKVTNVAELAEDETRYDETTTGGITTVTSSQTGQRKFTLQVQALVPEQTDEQWCMATLERVRMRLRRPRVLEQLLDVDVALISCGPAIPVQFKDKGRVFSSGTMDVVFGAVANEDDPISSGWIQYLVISSHVQNNDGIELPTGQQMVDVQIP